MGEDFPIWMKCLDEKESFRGLRINTQKTGKEELQRLLPFELTPVPWTENGCYIDGDGKASRHPAYAAGLYYLQEPSAMTPAACLPVEEGDRVLDLCAAPGGKATELAAKLGGTGILVANDISNSRAKALLKNLELCGAGNILVTSESPERLGSYFEGWFDKILIDAPCSGEGMFPERSVHDARLDRERTVLLFSDTGRNYSRGCPSFKAGRIASLFDLYLFRTGKRGDGS